MPLNVKEIRSKEFRGHSFNFAELLGTADADHASWWSFFDEEELREAWWRPVPGETVLDLGAAFGSYGIPALACGARVVFFSPADFDTELLSKNIELNPTLAPRALVLRDGLYSADGWFNPDRCVFQTEKPPRYEEPHAHVPPGGHWLRVTTLDATLARRPGIGPIAWIKIDVEGAELEVLKGAIGILRRDRPRILVENHEFHKPGISEQVRDFLVGLGLGYVCDGPRPHGDVSHSFYEVR